MRLCTRQKKPGKRRSLDSALCMYVIRNTVVACGVMNTGVQQTLQAAMC